jgi:quinol-cytochrome oxidoreductase complex cytochrome b subunit
VELIWGGFSVANATLNRFFSLHFLLPFVLAALAVGHMIALHVHGSSNPNGHSSHEDRYPMGPYFLFKDLITFFAFFWILSMTVCFYPNAMGHADNYLPADPMVTPASIVPEWYLLPFYAILRSIPNKLLGVIAMFSSLLVLLVAPVADKSRNRGSSYSPAYKILWSTFLAVFLLLMGLGQEHPEDPFIGLGQVTTGIYFGIFIVFLPLIAIAENTLYDTRSPKLTTFFANK